MTMMLMMMRGNGNRQTRNWIFRSVADVVCVSVAPLARRWLDERHYALQILGKLLEKLGNRGTDDLQSEAIVYSNVEYGRCF